mmetsp:Transcript_7251/g.10786  ORF Transcript_7251/g.10786 Transcript_7251/m.10786 type:complete len:302 (+) Transcript_7251:97-1002(+)|eukprot:CAMPEP_0185021168 /NCGR_PEP_ID=MMETSP1103-20130426/3847_1 /TAXON_ID=36769 /ORGANISM="Paraphysomonas bandaiensis, Strain Caron Lab Isolate" /LENGTH=301 /DNA_ID=CAMNT_0027552531 /DNA_START=86 /DNA_END=991 /DNA_ORIENTATION=-
MDEDEYTVERTLCQLPSVHVFRIPTLNTAVGYRAADWPKDPVWSGKLKITAKGRNCVIYLLDDQNNVFAKCPYNDNAVEKVKDSGRYFVLKIINDAGRHAFIGIAFNERNDAFDFNVSLQEHKNECEREDRAAAGELPSELPVQDRSIKQGEKIKVKIGNIGGSKREGKKVSNSTGVLAPPPAGGGLLAPPSSKPAGTAPPRDTSGVTSFDVFDTSTAKGGATDTTVFGFDSFASSDPFAPPTNPSAQSSGTSSSDPFASSNDPFASTSAASSDPFGFSVSSSTPSSNTNSSSNSNSLLDF